MQQKPALTIAISFAIISASVFFYFNSQTQETTITIERVIDGDTFVSDSGEIFRLLNINAPEKSEAGYDEARIFLKSYENSEVKAEIISVDKYGRTLARIYSGGYINLEIVKNGLGKKFLVQSSEIKEFDKAEKSAVENELGIWKKSKNWGCIETEIEPKKEVVFIKSLCGTLEIYGWTISDESRKKYKFPQFSLGELKLHSNVGKNNETDLFWNSNQNVWNNDRDTIYIFDKEGNVVLHHSYGY